MQWKQAAKQMAYWIVPPGIEELAGAYIRKSRRFDASMQAVLNRNKAFLNCHAGERCFILATGPSIREQDLTLLQDETCFAVSNFFVHPDFATIQPKYYCVAGHHKPITEAAWQSWLQEMSKGTGTATMFFALSDLERVERKGFFADRKVHYLKFGEHLDMLVSHGIDTTRTILGPQSVPVMALQLAIYMGFRYIYLLGCDHDHILHVGTSTHFYVEDEHVMVRAGYNEWSGSDLESECQSYIRLWRQYKSLQQVAQARSIHISNATAGGLLDVFPRVSYKSLFVQGDKGQAGCRTPSL